MLDDNLFNLSTSLDTKKSVLKTLAAMDLDKINMDLVESLLEWIVDGKHNYPPGKTPLTFKINADKAALALLLSCVFTGAVLVFLPGLAEIKMLYEQLQSNRMFNNRGASRSVSFFYRSFNETNCLSEADSLSNPLQMCGLSSPLNLVQRRAAGGFQPASGGRHENHHLHKHRRDLSDHRRCGVRHRLWQDEGEEVQDKRTPKSS